MDHYWLTNAKLVTPGGLLDGALRVSGGRIAAIRRRAPSGARRVDAQGSFVAPGLLDLHAWGDPQTLSRHAARGGTTAFLSTLGPVPVARLRQDAAAYGAAAPAPGARCLGLHLEGPFVNPARGGALPRRWMRAPSVAELARVQQAGCGRIRLITLAPELPGALGAIRWCRAHGVAVSLGHSDAGAAMARRALEAGARAVTHVFNGMRPFHHRHSALVGVALTEPRLVTMVIADGVHVAPEALKLLFRLKGASGIALVTDSVRSQRAAWALRKRQGAYYTPSGTLAGSALTMLQTVRHMVAWAGASLPEAVAMASHTPARLLGLERSLGALAAGRRADYIVFDRAFRLRLTVVGGDIVYERT